MALSFRTKANPQQFEAIQTTKGPVLIIAGPGSGKTFTLVERIVYLIKKKEPSRIAIRRDLHRQGSSGAYDADFQSPERSGHQIQSQ